VSYSKLCLPLLISVFLLSACERKASDAAPDPAQLIAKPCWFETDSSWPMTQCYMMEVPENYRKPAGRKIQFPVVRFIARSPDPDKQPLLHLGAGGPGASLGLEPDNASEWLWLNYADMTVDDGRDLILMDPRGVGMAKPRLTCTEFIEDAHTAFQRNLSPDEEARVFTFSMERCYSRLSKSTDLAYYNSVTVARDVEELRKKLNIKQWNLYGVSYSSRYALTIARDYPESVRALVLNSAVFPNIIYTQQLAQDVIAAYQRGLQHCRQDTLCNSRYPDLQRRLETLVQELDENPRSVPVTHVYSDGEYPFALTGQRLLRVLFQALYNENFYRELPEVIQALESDMDEPIRPAIADFMGIILDPNFGDAAGVSHFCYEEAPFVDFKKASKGASESGILGGAVRSDIQLMQIQCRIWAIPSASTLESQPVATPLPVLLLHGGLDPVLAATDANKARRKLPNHQWLLFPELAHDVISASDCAEEAAARFLNSPQEQLQESVTQCRQAETARQKAAIEEATRGDTKPETEDQKGILQKVPLDDSQ
jgi:pimeloyl-ACP methyl ester carboxylesterase